MKKTPWFSGDVKPVRVGVYERDVPGSGMLTYSYWTGRRWMFSLPNPRQAALMSSGSIVSGYQSIPWRGIVKEAS